VALRPRLKSAEQGRAEERKNISDFLIAIMGSKSSMLERQREAALWKIHIGVLLAYNGQGEDPTFVEA
jgi:hypothetical protein